MDNLFQLLGALGSLNFQRGYLIYGQSRQEVLSHLIRITYPVEKDTKEGFAQQARCQYL